MGRLAILRAFLAAKRRARHRHPADAHTHFPVITEREFRERFQEFNVLGLTLEQARAAVRRELETGEPSHPGFSFGFSSGTTGEPGVFITSQAERDQWVGTVLARFLDWKQLAGVRIALLLKHNNRLYTDVANTRRVRLEYFDIAAPLAEWTPRLCRLSPEVLVGPPSSLLAVAASDAFHRAPFTPGTLVAGAEPLFPRDRDALERAYGAAPRGIYQATEGFLGAGCRHGRIHLNEDLAIFEAQRFRQDRRRFVPIVTDIRRTSQTYRRYRLDDVLIASDTPCPCGSPFFAIDAIEGRFRDVFLRRLADALDPIFPLDLDAVMSRHSEPAIRYAITQHSFDSYTLAIDHPPAARLIEELRDVLEATIYITAYQPEAPGHKRRRFRREFDLHSEQIVTGMLFPPANLRSI